MINEQTQQDPGSPSTINAKAGSWTHTSGAGIKGLSKSAFRRKPKKIKETREGNQKGKGGKATLPGKGREKTAPKGVVDKAEPGPCRESKRRTPMVLHRVWACRRSKQGK